MGLVETLLSDCTDLTRPDSVRLLASCWPQANNVDICHWSNDSNCN